MSFAITLAIISGLFDASSRLAIKASRFDPFLLLGVGFLSALPFYGIWLAYTGIPRVEHIFWIVIAFHVPLFLLAQWMTVKAHRVSKLTIAAPYLSLTTLFLFATSPIMVGVVPSMWGFLGALLIVSGIILVHTSGIKGFGDLWRNARNEPGVQFLLGVALIYAITSNLDKIALNTSSAPFFLTVDVSLTALGAFSLYVVTKTKARKEHAAIQKKASYLPAMVYGLVLGLSVIIHMTALGMTDQVPYVLAGKRAGTVLFATLGGLLLGLISSRHHAELHDYKRKVASAIIVILGTLLIVLWG